MICVICNQKECKDKIHKEIMQWYLYYDENGELKISKGGISKLEKYEQKLSNM